MNKNEIIREIEKHTIEERNNKGRVWDEIKYTDKRGNRIKNTTSWFNFK